MEKVKTALAILVELEKYTSEKYTKISLGHAIDLLTEQLNGNDKH
jgi:hypothetical protein